MMRKTYNPYHVKTEELIRFRGISDSDNEQMTPKEYVESSDNLDSFKIREMTPRLGQDVDNEHEEMTDDVTGGVVAGKKLITSQVILKGTHGFHSLISPELVKPDPPDFIRPIVSMAGDGGVSGVITDIDTGSPIDVSVVKLNVDGTPRSITTDAADSGTFDFGRVIGDDLHINISSEHYLMHGSDIEQSPSPQSYPLSPNPDDPLSPDPDDPPPDPDDPPPDPPEDNVLGEELTVKLEWSLSQDYDVHIVFVDDEERKPNYWLYHDVSLLDIDTYHVSTGYAWYGDRTSNPYLETAVIRDVKLGYYEIWATNANIFSDDEFEEEVSVSIYSGEDLIETLVVPNQSGGRSWKVCSIDDGVLASSTEMTSDNLFDGLWTVAGSVVNTLLTSVDIKWANGSGDDLLLWDSGDDQLLAYLLTDDSSFREIPNIPNGQFYVTRDGTTTPQQALPYPLTGQEVTIIIP